MTAAKRKCCFPFPGKRAGRRREASPLLDQAPGGRASIFLIAQYREDGFRLTGESNRIFSRLGACSTRWDSAFSLSLKTGILGRQRNFIPRRIGKNKATVTRARSRNRNRQWRPRGRRAGLLEVSAAQRHRAAPFPVPYPLSDFSTTM
jgi:hypothetical protein